MISINNFISNGFDWENDDEWTIFFWKNNILGIYQIISDCLLKQFPSGLMRKYNSTTDLKFNSEEAIDLMREFEEKKLLVQRKFSFSLWCVVTNYKEKYIETLIIEIKNEHFELKYENGRGESDYIYIPLVPEKDKDIIWRDIQISDKFSQITIIKNNIIKNELIYGRYNQPKGIQDYLEKCIKDDIVKINEILKQVDDLKLERDIVLEKLIRFHNQEIDIDKFGKLVKRFLLTKLPEMTLTPASFKGTLIHVIEVDFGGKNEIIINPSNLIH